MNVNITSVISQIALLNKEQTKKSEKIADKSKVASYATTNKNTSGTDQKNISQDATFLAQTHTELTKLDNAHSQKILSLKKQIQEGTYEIDLQKAADSLLRAEPSIFKVPAKSQK